MNHNSANNKMTQLHIPRVSKLSKIDDANNDEYIITELTSDEDHEEERP